jgi:hypothetical protein
LDSSWARVPLVMAREDCAIARGGLLENGVIPRAHRFRVPNDPDRDVGDSVMVEVEVILLGATCMLAPEHDIGKLRAIHGEAQDDSQTHAGEAARD